MSKQFVWLLAVLFIVVFMDGLVHLLRVTPWFAAGIIVLFVVGAVRFARDESLPRG